MSELIFPSTGRLDEFNRVISRLRVTNRHFDMWCWVLSVYSTPDWGWLFTSKPIKYVSWFLLLSVTILTNLAALYRARLKGRG